MILSAGITINVLLPGDVDMLTGLGVSLDIALSSLSRSHDIIGVGVPDAAQITDKFPVDFLTMYVVDGVVVKLGLIPVTWNKNGATTSSCQHGMYLKEDKILPPVFISQCKFTLSIACAIFNVFFYWAFSFYHCVIG